MLIERLTVREIEIPLRAPFVTTTGSVTARRLLLLELEDGDGTIGWAECVAGAVPGYSPETVDTAWHTITTGLAPEVVGVDVDGPSELLGTLVGLAPAEPMARAAVEMAWWDLSAQRSDLSLARLLGGTRERVPAGIALGLAATPQETAAAASAAVARGYRRVKIKIEPGADLVFVRAVREAIGFDIPLTVDANGSYTRADVEHLAALDEFSLQMIEQPLPADDLDGHAALQRRLETPICLDESIVDLADLEEAIARGSARTLNLKPGRVGGFTTVLAMIEPAIRHGIDLWVGGMLETGIGRAHNVALASLEAFGLPGDLGPGDRYWTEDIVEPPWTMQDGSLRVPHNEPGIGVSIDRARVRSLTTRVQEIRPAP